MLQFFFLTVRVSLLNDNFLYLLASKKKLLFFVHAPKLLPFFFVVQVKQKEKNFHSVMKLKDQTIKADKQLKKLFLFFIRFKSNKRERFFCIVDAFFWQMEMFLFFENKNRQTGQQFRKSIKKKLLKQQRQLLLFLFLSTCLKAQEQEQKKS